MCFDFYPKAGSWLSPECLSYLYHCCMIKYIINLALRPEFHKFQENSLKALFLSLCLHSCKAEIFDTWFLLSGALVDPGSTAQRDPILSFLHTFPPKKHLRRRLAPPPNGNPGSAIDVLCLKHSFNLIKYDVITELS